MLGKADFLAGREFSMGDIPLGCCLNRYMQVPSCRSHQHHSLLGGCTCLYVHNPNSPPPPPCAPYTCCTSALALFFVALLLVFDIVAAAATSTLCSTIYFTHVHYYCGARAIFKARRVECGHILNLLPQLDIPKPNLPNLKAYYERLKRRPAFVSHVSGLPLS